MKFTTSLLVTSSLLTPTLATWYTPQAAPLPAIAALNQLLRTATQPKNATLAKNQTEMYETSGPRASLLAAGLAAEINAQQGQLQAIDAIIALQSTELLQQGQVAPSVAATNVTRPVNATRPANLTVKFSPPTRFRPNIIRVPFSNTTTTSPSLAPAGAKNTTKLANSPAPSTNSSNATLTVDATPYFVSAKNTLLAFMRATATIRQNNLFLSNVNSQVERGLAQLEAQQVKQYGLVMRLTGNAQGDATTLKSLRAGVVAGLAASRGLMSAATGGSAVPEGLVTKTTG